MWEKYRFFYMASEASISDFRTHHSLWYILSLILQVLSGCLLPTCSRIYWEIRQHLPTRNLQQIMIATQNKSLCQRWWEMQGWGGGGPGQHSTFCTAPPFTQEPNWWILVPTSSLSKPAFRVCIYIYIYGKKVNRCSVWPTLKSRWEVSWRDTEEKCHR